MDYREMQGAVFTAYRGRNFALCFSLLDQFIETADTQERARALSLKAGVISQADHRRAAEGLVLVEEALQFLQDNPGQTLYNLVTALSLCYAMGDVGRATEYQHRGHRLLREHCDDPDVQAGQFRLHLNLGVLAAFRGEHATAYWHFVQGTTSLLSARPQDRAEADSWLFWLYLHTATACLAMGRLPEVVEALQQVEKLAVTAKQRVRWAVARADLLREQGRPHEAAAVLSQAQEPPEDAWDAESRTRYLIALALAAQDLDNLHGFHRHLSEAQKEAADHSLDFLLTDIQRIQRGQLANPNLGG